jgi:hypothetical protein
VSSPPVELPLAAPVTATAGSAGISRGEWLRLARWARLLSWASLLYMAVEGGVALVAGVLAGSVALVGFGLDSAIEGFASLVIVWRFSGSRLFSDHAEHRAQRLVAIQFFVLAPYIGVQAIRDLAGAGHPGASWVGIGLAAGSIVLMPLLGIAKQRIGRRMGSVATQGEGAQNLLCAYMAGALLVGLGGNAVLGLWWLDPVAALAIAGLAVREGVEAWRGESCCMPATSTAGDCTEECCAPTPTPTPTSAVSPLAECRLDTAGLRAQVDRYRRLGKAATGVDRHDGTLVATFGAELDPGLLEETISVERGCCPFFDFDYRPAGRRLVITVHEPDQEPALDALHYAFTGREANASSAVPEAVGPVAPVMVRASTAAGGERAPNASSGA